MHYKVLQLKKFGREIKYSFCDYNFALEHGFTLDDYEVIYENDVEVTTLSNEEFLESLFTLFNMHRPEDYKGHSLSVSDIVELDNIKYYCDFLGWRRLD